MLFWSLNPTEHSFSPVSSVKLYVLFWILCYRKECFRFWLCSSSPPSPSRLPLKSPQMLQKRQLTLIPSLLISHMFDVHMWDWSDTVTHEIYQYHKTEYPIRYLGDQRRVLTRSMLPFVYHWFRFSIFSTRFSDAIPVQPTICPYCLKECFTPIC